MSINKRLISLFASFVFVLVTVAAPPPGKDKPGGVNGSVYGEMFPAR